MWDNNEQGPTLTRTRPLFIVVPKAINLTYIRNAKIVMYSPCCVHIWYLCVPCEFAENFPAITWRVLVKSKQIVCITNQQERSSKVMYNEYKIINTKQVQGQFSVPTDVINICRKIRIRKFRHYGGQAM